jgi:hypothetical protein
MEMSQGNSLYSYVKKQKCHFFFLLQKNGEQEGRTDPVWGVSTSRRREDVGKGVEE